MQLNVQNHAYVSIAASHLACRECRRGQHRGRSCLSLVAGALLTMALCKPFLLGMASVLKKNLGQAIIPAVLRTTPWLIWILFAGTVAFSISVSALDVVWKVGATGDGRNG